MILSIFIFIKLIQFSHGQAPLSWISYDMDYGNTFDGNLKWYNCDDGYVIGGFYKSNGNYLSSLQKIRCVRPDTDSIITQTCQTKSIHSSFDNAGDAKCDDGYFVKGIQSNTGSTCALFCWEDLNCCQYDTNVISVGDIEYQTEDWNTCFDEDNVWCLLPNTHYINGFYRSGTSGNNDVDADGVYRLEIGYSRELSLITDTSSLPDSYLGCYRDESERAMREFIGTDHDIASCGEACKEYRYYGLQNGGECRCDDDWIHSIKYGKADDCRDDGLGAGWRNSMYKTVSPLDITVTACNGWDYGSITNSMQIQLSGVNGASEYIYVNQDSQLPVNGGSSSFQNSISNIGELYHVKIMVDDEYGFCLSALTISYDNNEYIFDSDNSFGSGLILASECSYSYRFISDGLPLIQCHTGFIELSPDETRGIYNLNIHSCIGDENGISAENMKNNVYATIMGKKNGEQTYSTTTISYLDHFKPSQVNIIELGDLIAGNVLITDTAINALYSPVEGTLIGVKLEIISAVNKFKATSSTNIKTNGNERGILSKYAFDDGKYLVLFFDEDDRVNLENTQEIYIYGGSIVNVNINIFGIFAGNEKKYALSFKMMDNGNNGITWFDANEKCETYYSTQLASIHSEEENFLITGFMGDDHAWIGFQDVTVQEQNNWHWSDLSATDYSNWAPNEPNNQNGEDCAHAWPCSRQNNGACKWNDLDCNDATNVKKYICSSPHWPPNAQRSFEINVPQIIDDITLISIGNNNRDDSLCIDSVITDSNAASYLSDNNIGGNDGPFALTAIIKYPVCKTEVVGFRVDYDTSTSNLLNGDSSISGLECKNGNRLIPSTCSISQSYELSKTTSFSISNENSDTSEYSWGSSSSVSFGTASSTSTSDEFSFGFDQSITVGASATVEGSIGFASASATVSTEVSVGANQQWTSSTEQSNERSRETSNENNEQNTESSTYTNAYESSYETSETTTIECAAEIEVPPSHSVKYSLIFNAFNTTINTYTDIKLTLCSAFINCGDDNDESYYKYIDNIPGVINHKETTACEVQFNPAEYIRNDMGCDEEQRLSFSSDSTYIPRCQIDDPSLYAPCQCNIGDTDLLSACMCVDSTGNMLTNKLMHVEDDDSWQRICVEELACGDSSVVWSSAGSISDELHIDEPRDEPRPPVRNLGNWTIESFTHWMWEIMGIIFIVFGMYYIKKYMNDNKNDQVLLKGKLINYEEHIDEEVIPIKEDIA